MTEPVPPRKPKKRYTQDDVEQERRRTEIARLRFERHSYKETNIRQYVAIAAAVALLVAVLLHSLPPSLAGGGGLLAALLLPRIPSPNRNHTQGELP